MLPETHARFVWIVVRNLPRMASQAGLSLNPTSAHFPGPIGLQSANLPRPSASASTAR